MEQLKTSSRRHTYAFTLAEVVMCIAIVVTLFAGIIMAYTNANRRAKWSGYSLAAQALAIQQIEQSRSARWDIQIATVTNINEVTNLNLFNKSFVGGVLTGHTTNILNIPVSAGNVTLATNYITDYQTFVNWGGSPSPVLIRFVRVDTAWPFTWGTTNRYFTNTICSYCALDN